MKHTFKVTLLLALIFLVAQIVGLVITKEYISTEEYIDPETKAVVKQVVSEDLPYNLERPEIEESTSYIWILSAIIIGTLLLLAIIKFRKKVNIIVWWALVIILILDMASTFLNILKFIENLELELYLIIRLLIEIILLCILIRLKEKFDSWKLWFFLAVFSTVSIAFAAFMPQAAAIILAFMLALAKIYRPAAVLNNFTEIFIYGGLAAMFVPVINLFAAFALLFLISIYDIIAVRHTKHMVKLAKFQAKSRVFAGLLLLYGKGKGIAAEGKGIIKDREKGKIAVLGGGDIGFPLLFSGAVMKELMLVNSETIGFLKALIIPVFVTLALVYLLITGEKDKFYPAMPYLAIGCVFVYLVILLLL